MKKIATAILITTALLLPLSGNAQFLVGGNISKSISSEITIENNINELTADTNNKSLMFFVGYKNNKNNRFLLSIDKLNIDLKDYSDNSDATGLRFDWQFVYTENNIKPYWGIGFGFYSLKDSPLLSDTNLANDTHNGVSFQMTGGTKIDLTENIELDIALQYQGFSWEDLDVTYRSGRTETRSMSNNQITLGAGVAFKF